MFGQYFAKTSHISSRVPQTLTYRGSDAIARFYWNKLAKLKPK